MPLPLLISASGVVHVEGCVRLRNAGHPARVRAWDGGIERDRGLHACHSCLFPGQTKAIKHRPCPACHQKVAQPCRHTGVLVTVDRVRRGPQRIFAYPDRVLEREFLLRLLDSK